MHIIRMATDQVSQRHLNGGLEKIDFDNPQVRRESTPLRLTAFRRFAFVGWLHAVMLPCKHEAADLGYIKYNLLQ